VYNGRIDRYPSAIFYAHTTDDVSKAVACAYDYGMKVSPSSGRQSFTGASIQDDYLVVDVSNMTQVRITHHYYYHYYYYYYYYYYYQSEMVIVIIITIPLIDE